VTWPGLRHRSAHGGLLARDRGGDGGEGEREGGGGGGGKERRLSYLTMRSGALRS